MSREPVYSIRMSGGHAGSVKDIDVPAGYVYVIRFITVFNASAIAGETFHMFSSTFSWTYYQQTYPPVTAALIDLRLVLAELETVEFSNDGDIDYTVSGYALTLP